ncbi:glycosyltransferase family 4 protein [Thermocoleostomius sinensis]|uniref:Glycosyltransferase family 4 protein n=1 Tax=Thermocoleostomius sinensis A174 TaxID=2016057 RepID=A0A9E9CA16_9CYAN|nr:glycosyltransferase family 4 protein [Thermocoleostomius sinensis]WAL58385.1 glycosyltransferase family 4 protein [Thermocoleostomius sinensis A174]
MKLCIATQTVNKGNGQGRVNYEIVREAITRSHTVTLLASSIAPELQKHPLIEWVPILTDQLPTAILRDLFFAWKSTRWLHQHHSSIDIIKVNGAITFATADINAIHFVHSAWLKSGFHTIRYRKDFYGLYQWLYTNISAQWEVKAFYQARLLVAVSEQVKRELIELGLSASSIQVILNGVDLAEFQPGAIDRESLGLPRDVPIALFAGDIRTPRKNLDMTLFALARVPGLHLAVAGDTVGSPYPQIAADLKVDKRTHFLGYRSDIAKIMQGVDFFVFPSRYEACSLVLLEALASGLPVITAATTGGSELITSECGIVLSNPENVDDLTNAVEHLANNSDIRSVMGKHARRLAEQYAWNKQAKNYVDLFEKLSLSKHCSKKRHSTNAVLTIDK